MKYEQSLLPCPFCGANATLENMTFGDNTEENYRANCKNGHSLDWWETNKCDAIKLWNTRTPIVQQPLTTIKTAFNGKRCMTFELRTKE
jgi:hypothetical protein